MILAMRLGTRQALRRMGQLPILSVLVLSIVVFSAIMAPWIAPHEPQISRPQDRLEPPVWMDGGSAKYLLGTDHQGRDLFSRLLYGARVSLIVAGATFGLGGTVGVLLGLLAGWYGRWVDDLITRLVDTMLAVPGILIALAAVAVFGPSITLIVLVLAMGMFPQITRMVRGQVLSLKEMDYVAMAQVSGASTWRILYKHLFPGVINTVIILSTLQVGQVILSEAALSYLAVGVPPPTPAWGSMVADGRDKLNDAWWVATVPGFAILFTVVSLNMFGDWLRDALDPILRQAE